MFKILGYKIFINVNVFSTKLGTRGFPIIPEFSSAIEMTDGTLFGVDLEWIRYADDGIIGWLRPQLPEEIRPSFNIYDMFIPMPEPEHYVSKYKFIDLVTKPNNNLIEHIPNVAFIQLDRGFKYVAKHFALWDIKTPRTSRDYLEHVFITIPKTNSIYASKTEVISIPNTDLQAILAQVPSHTRDERFH